MLNCQLFFFEDATIVSKMDIRKNPTVMKFGGTSVQDVAAFTRVAEIVVSEKHHSPIVITSAMSKVTDALLSAFQTAKGGASDEAFASLNIQFERHYKISENLLDEARQNSFQTEMNFAQSELRDLLHRAARRSLPLSLLKDAIVSYGEQLASRLLTEVCQARNLNARHIDARRLIVTDDEYGAATPIWEETEKLIRLELENL